MWAISGAIVVLFAFLGCFLGNLFLPAEDRPNFVRLLIVLVNLFAMYATVGSLALLVSSLSDRRGRAVAVAFGIVIFSFLLNFLAQFWELRRGQSPSLSADDLAAIHEPAATRTEHADAADDGRRHMR